MKLTYDFDEDFFRLMVSEEFEKAIRESCPPSCEIRVEVKGVDRI